MDLNAKIATAKALIEQRQAIDDQLTLLFGGDVPYTVPTPASLVEGMKEAIQRKAITCKNCGQPGHNTRSCTAPPRNEMMTAPEPPREYQFK